MKIDFTIDKTEALRYAGHKGRVPDYLSRIADKVMGDISAYLTPKYISGRYKITPVDSGVQLAVGLILQGEDIKKHLAGCSECYIICATVGIGADNFIRMSMAADTVQGIVADGAATRAVESYCDSIENSLRRQLKTENKYLTHRYSPGYGDFPFTQQPDILALLQAEKLVGVTANTSRIMTPAKSVTAVMGIADKKPAERGDKCADCPNKDNCNFSCR